MAEWNKNKVLPSEINGGKEFTTDDNLTVAELNLLVSNSFYGVDFVEAMADEPDTSEANNVGVPSVSFVNNGNFKKFKFSNLKGSSGSKLVSQVLQGKDENGGNIYLQTFDDGSTATFTAPKGEGVVSVMTFSPTTFTEMATFLNNNFSKILFATTGISNVTSDTGYKFQIKNGSTPTYSSYASNIDMSGTRFRVSTLGLGGEKFVDVSFIGEKINGNQKIINSIIFNSSAVSGTSNYTYNVLLRQYIETFADDGYSKTYLTKSWLNESSPSNMIYIFYVD